MVNVLMLKKIDDTRVPEKSKAEDAGPVVFSKVNRDLGGGRNRLLNIVCFGCSG